MKTLGDPEDHKRTEEVLQNHLHFIQTLIDTIPSPIFYKDCDSLYRGCNQAFAELIGKTREEIIGKSVFDVAPVELAQIYRSTDLKLLQKPGAMVYETSIPHVDGTLRDILVNKATLSAIDGTVVGVVGTVLDITERKAMEEALRSSEERYRRLFEDSPVSLWEVDFSEIRNHIEHLRAKGIEDIHSYLSDDLQAAAYCGSLVRIIDANRSTLELFGVEKKEDLSDELGRIIRRAIHYVGREELREAASGRAPVEFETPAHTIEGAPLNLAVRCTVAPGHEKTFSKVFISIVDVAEREHRRVERIKNEFISMVSHELRTPLTSIRGALGLIEGGIGGELPDQARYLVGIARSNSDRLINIINDILDIEKIESGKMDFKMSPVELMPLIIQTIDANRTYGKQFDVEFNLTGMLPGAFVYADSNRLAQVMSNLLSNAAKFSPAGTVVDVSVTEKNGTIRVAVIDRGRGISEEFRNRIFQKFAQADSSDIRTRGGTGLGLSIAKAIVERHGGIIGFETETGKGSTFYYELAKWQEPVHPLSSNAARGIVFPHAHAAGRFRSRILICEDDRDIAHLIDLMLRQEGFETEVAYNAAQAMKLLKQKRFDAMTLDIRLPDQDGLSLIRWICSEEKTRKLPIIVVSVTSKEEINELNEAEFMIIDWLEKPIDENRLKSALRYAVATSESERPRFLHVEDDPDIREVVSYTLRDMAELASASMLSDAKEILKHDNFDVVILDVMLPDGSGLDLLPSIIGIPVAIYSVSEVPPDIARQVAAVLVKSRTTNEELVTVIKSLIKQKNIPGESTHG